MEIKQKANRWVANGAFVLSKYTFSMNEESKKNSDYHYHRFNFNADCGQGNVIFGGIMGGKNKVVYAHGKKQKLDKDKKPVYKDGKPVMMDDWKDKIEIPWDKRFDDAELAKLGNQSFIRVSIEKDEKGELITKRFLAEWDLIEYLKETLEDGTPLYVQGEFERQRYNGEYQTNKTVTYISLLNDKIKPEDYNATFKQTYYATSESYKGINPEGTAIELELYAPQYVGKPHKTTVLMPETVKVPLDKFGDNAEIIAKKFFGPIGDKVNQITVTGTLLDGAQTMATDVTDLPEDIQLLVQYGVLTLEKAISQCATGTKEQSRNFQSIEIEKVKVEGQEEKQPRLGFVENITTIDKLKFYGDLKEGGSTPKEKLNEEMEEISQDADMSELLSFITNSEEA